MQLMASPGPGDAISTSQTRSSNHLGGIYSAPSLSYCLTCKQRNNALESPARRMQIRTHTLPRTIGRLPRSTGRTVCKRHYRSKAACDRRQALLIPRSVVGDSVPQALCAASS